MMSQQYCLTILNDNPTILASGQEIWILGIGKECLLIMCKATNRIPSTKIVITKEEGKRGKEK